MTRASQKEKEKRIVKAFCKCLGTPFFVIKPASERPDVHINFNGKTVGIEITEHLNDVTKDTNNGSPGKMFQSFWEKVNNKCKEFKKGCGLDNVHVYVSLENTKLDKHLGSPKIINGIAEQLVEFVKNEISEVKSDIIVIPRRDKIFEKSFRRSDFTRFNFLAQYVDTLRITQNEAYFIDWNSNIGSCFIGINATDLAYQVTQKNEKAKKYHVENMDELWLLIAAAHDDSFSAMRIPEDQIDHHIDFCCSEIIDACKGTPFDKIYFFANRPDDSSKAWCRRMWPREKD